MSILDDAIREHLELKRKHGAREVEVQELEHEAFGPALQTGELPASPQAAEVSELAEAAAHGDAIAEAPPEIDLGLAEIEPPEFEMQPQAPPEFEPATEAPAQELPAEPVEQPVLQPPTQEFELDQAPAAVAGHQTGAAEDYMPPSPPEPPPPGTEERVLPFGRPEPGTEGAPAPESYEPPTEPTLEEPLDKIGESLSVITSGGSPTADFYDFDEEEEEAGSHIAEEAPPEAEHAPAGHEPAEEEGEYEEVEEGEYEGEEGEPEGDEFVPEGKTAEFFDVESDADVLEETPDFLRERPDDEELWFEQRPPKDFDL